MDDARFLRGRLDEEAALAEASSPGPWRANAESDEVIAVDGVTVADGFALSGRQLRATTEHIAFHDPIHILAQINEKRRTIVRCEEAMRSGAPMLAQFARQTLREMARPYESPEGSPRELSPTPKP